MSNGTAGVSPGVAARLAAEAATAAAKAKGYDVFIRNLPEETTPEQLTEFFGEAGKIIRAPRLNLGRGFAWITFGSMEAVAKAVSWSGCYFGSRILYMHPANNVAPSDHGGRFGSDIGSHIPALCEETVQKLVAPQPDGVYVDGTFGRGGHSKAMLAAMSPAGRLHAFDMDPEAIRVGKELMAADARFTIHHARFSTMKRVLAPIGVAPGSVAGVLLDVGISSPQFDDASRGFRPEADGPLDLRFDIGHGAPASEFLLTVPHAELVRARARRAGRLPRNCLKRRRAQLDPVLRRGVATELASAS